MSVQWIYLVVSFIFAISFSFLCSILEAVLLSISPSYVHVKDAEGSRIAKNLKKFKQDIDRPLSAILTLNTIAHTIGSIMVGAQAVIIYEGQTWEPFGVHVPIEGLVAGLMTFAILIFSEIIPKTLGANNWKALVPFTVHTLKVLIFLLWPLIWLSQLITKQLKNEKEKSVLSRTDFLAMTYAVTEEGVIDEEESKIINNVLQWNDIASRQIMTPRTVLLACREETTIKAFYENKNLRYSRIPIYKERMDDIDSYFLKDDLLEAIVKGDGENPVSSIKRKMHIIPETQNIDKVFRALMSKKEHIALVVDEFGGVEGIVTLEDIMETILGTEIMDETDRVADLQEIAKQKGIDKLSE